MDLVGDADRRVEVSLEHFLVVDRAQPGRPHFYSSKFCDAEGRGRGRNRALAFGKVRETGSGVNIRRAISRSVFAWTAFMCALWA